MGHGVPYPYSLAFIGLMKANDKGLITKDKAHKTWVKVCDAWQRNNPGSYSQ